MDDADRKYRNYVIAAAVGGFLLPLAGVVGALLFYSRDDREAATWVIGASIAGAVAYVIAFVVF